MKASGAPSLFANRSDTKRIARLEMALVSSGIACRRGGSEDLHLDVSAGVYSLSASEDDSLLTLSAHLPLAGYLKGERPLQHLLDSVGEGVSGVRWMMSTENVHLVVERIGNATIADDVLWVIGSSGLLDQAISELDTQARTPEHSLWHFAKIRSVAR